MALGAAIMLGIGLVAKSVQTGFNIDAVEKQKEARLNTIRNEIDNLEEQVDLSVYLIEQDMIDQVGTFNAAAAAEQVGGRSVELAQQSLALQAGFNVGQERGLEAKQLEALRQNMANVKEQADREKLNQWLNLAGAGIETGAGVWSEVQARAPKTNNTDETKAEESKPKVGE